MNRIARLTLAAAACTAIGVSVLSVDGSVSAHGTRHKTTLRDASGAVLGKASFVTSHGHTEVTVVLYRLPAGAALDAFHGFHIHANNVPDNGNGCVGNADPALAFVSADGHWNNEDGVARTHGNHVGDLPSLYVNDDGSVSATFTIDRVQAGLLKGKALVLHAGPDNFGNVPLGDVAAAPNAYTPNSAGATTATQNTGNAGNRIACGVIVNA
jgi:superoxide dismutase, Cu-Zn family